MFIIPAFVTFLAFHESKKQVLHNFESNWYLETYIEILLSDKPMVPFLNTDLCKLVKSLLERFVKSVLLKDVTSMSKLTSIDISKANCFVDYSKVDIGFTTKNAVKAVRKNMSDKQLRTSVCPAETY